MATDAWAPRQFVFDKTGTSFSAAYATGVLAAALSRFPELASAPAGTAFRYIHNVARTDIVVPDHIKVIQSPMAGTRFVSKINFVAPNITALAQEPWAASDARDYCQELTADSQNSKWPVNFPTSNPSSKNWDDTENKVTTTDRPLLVDEWYEDWRDTWS
jgi:hypothetical protein